MSLLSGTGTTLPTTLQYYDPTISSFTLPALSTGPPYEVTGSRRNISISAAKNVTKANATDDVVAAVFWWHISALITSTTTDTCNLSVQYSTNGGSSWSFVTGCTVTLTAASINKSVSQCLSGANGVLDNIQGNAFTNPLIFRSVIEDATDPTTDALSLTNIHCTLAMLVMK